MSQAVELYGGKNFCQPLIDKEIVILNMAKNNYVGLDEIGLRIWELLGKPTRVDELCSQLSREFDATLEQITADVVPFLADLEKEGLVQSVDKQSE